MIKAVGPIGTQAMRSRYPAMGQIMSRATGPVPPITPIEAAIPPTPDGRRFLASLVSRVMRRNTVPHRYSTNLNNKDGEIGPAGIAITSSFGLPPLVPVAQSNGADIGQQAKYQTNQTQSNAEKQAIAAQPQHAAQGFDAPGSYSNLGAFERMKELYQVFAWTSKSTAIQPTV